jgi:hypothetical protein
MTNLHFSCVLHLHTLSEAENLFAEDAQTTVMLMIDLLFNFRTTIDYFFF